MTSVTGAGDATTLDRMAGQAITSDSAFYAELMLAARRREIAILIAQPTSTAPMRLLKQTTLPVLAILPDDPGDAGRGPDGWLATRRLARWAEFGVIHGTGGTVAHYRQIVDLTKHHRRLLLVECSSLRAEEWATALWRHRGRQLPSLAFLPPPGGVHPMEVPP